MSDERHLVDDLQELADGRLAAAERARAQAHLADCEACRRELDVLLALKSAVRSAGAPADLPPELDALIRGGLDREPGAGEARRLSRAVPWLIAAAVAVLAILTSLLLRPGVSARVASDYTAYRGGALSLELETGEPQKLEAFFRERGLTFRTRVLDLRMMGFELVGGRVHRIGGRPSAFFVYRGERNKILVCQMYAGEIGDLPRNAQRREINGIPFHVARRGGITMVFWPEGDVACVLVSDIASEEVFALAVGKAMKP